MPKRVAIVGVGMQKYEFRKEQTVEEMVFDVTRNALENSHLSREDIDAVVFGSAVDAFCGIHNSDKVAIDASGGLLKPTMRNSTSGSVSYTHLRAHET